jgi:hypothetical protein
MKFTVLHDVPCHSRVDLCPGFDVVFNNRQWTDAWDVRHGWNIKACQLQGKLDALRTPASTRAIRTINGYQ